MDHVFATPPLIHQRDGFDRYKNSTEALLLWDTGCGKTWLGVNLIRYYLNTVQTTYRNLIICPKSVCNNWRNEIGTHGSPNMKRSSVVLTGSKAKRLRVFRENKHRIYIINYEGLLMLKEELVKEVYGIIVWDEMHRVKNKDAKQSKISLDLSRKSFHRIGLTATLILNNPTDVFMPFMILDHGKTFGENFFAFRAHYMVDKNASWAARPGYFPKWEPRKEMYEEMNSKIYRIADRKKKEDCLDLPDKTYEVRYADLTPEQEKLYKEMEKDLITYLNDEACVAQTALTKVLRLSQIASGSMTTVSGETVNIPCEKTAIAKELMEEIAPAKAVIWCRFTHDIKLLMTELAKYNPVAMYGETKDDQAVVDTFEKDPKCRLCIAQVMKSEGYNLIEAEYSIFYSQDYSLKNREQAEGRNYRHGSKKKVTYIDILSKGTIDEIISAAVKSKKDMSRSILEFKKEIESQQNADL